MFEVQQFDILSSLTAYHSTHYSSMMRLNRKIKLEKTPQKRVLPEAAEEGEAEVVVVAVVVVVVVVVVVEGVVEDFELVQDSPFGGNDTLSF
jgi:uncharacterized membrane protein